MINRIARFIAEHSLIRPDATLLVGVSGGPDSLCLLHVLSSLRQNLGISLHVAHLDHQLRGAESNGDAAFVAAIGRDWQLPYTIESADVQAIAEAQRLNLHDAARRVRYAFFARLASQIGADAVAVAHTANDQAETVLMHLLRGAGAAGLSGMQPISRMPPANFNQQPATLTIVRPLLAVTRADVEAYCAAHGLTPRQDATNVETAYTRNRIRHELLPLLITYNPQIVRTLGTTATIAAEDAAFIQHALDLAWNRLAHQQAAAVRLDGVVWRQLHPALQRAALRRAYAALGGSTTLTWEHTEQARLLATGPVGRRMPLPDGIWLHVDYGGGMTLGQAAVDGPQLTGDSAALAIPGHVALADGWTLVAQTAAPANQRNRWTIRLSQPALAPPLLVRGRRAGDQIQLEHGRKSLQDVFVDAKIPRALRDRWPLIVDTQQILWITGVRAARGVRGDDQQTAAWIRIIPPDVAL